MANSVEFDRIRLQPDACAEREIQPYGITVQLKVDLAAGADLRLVALYLAPMHQTGGDYVNLAGQHPSFAKWNYPI
ncbi:MAG: hypothetical protein H7255_20765 [Ramlibacter sp.]|nr:hypothetical protein [Ramlibacter sp.]